MNCFLRMFIDEMRQSVRFKHTKITFCLSSPLVAPIFPFPNGIDSYSKSNSLSISYGQRESTQSYPRMHI